MSTSVAQRVDFRTILSLNGTLCQLQLFKAAMSQGFQIVGIDDDTDNMTSAEALEMSTAREVKQVSVLRKLNAEGKNCIAIIGIRHLMGIRRILEGLSKEEQANYKLVYAYGNSMLDDGRKNDDSNELEEWMALRTSSFSTGLLPVQSYHVSDSVEKEAFLKDVLHYVPEPFFESPLVRYGMLALAAGVGLFAYGRRGLPVSLADVSTALTSNNKIGM